MSRSSSSNLDSKVYVGDLGNNASKGELEDAFSYYGRLKSVWVARNPPGFAFIEFEDPRDAEDAVRGLDGRNVCGRRVRVELSTGRSRSSRGYSGPSRRGRPFHPEDRCYECGGRGHYARDCPQYSRGKKRSTSRSRSRSRSRGRRSASGSRGRDSRGRSKSYSRSRSRSRRRSDSRSRSHSKSVHRDSRERSRSKSRDRSRERSKSRTSNRDSRSKSRSRSRSKSRRSSRSRSARSNSRSPSRTSD